MEANKNGRTIDATNAVQVDDVLNLTIGLVIQSDARVFEITNIEVQGIHLGSPYVWITYKYDTSDFQGEETVSLANFIENIN